MRMPTNKHTNEKNYEIFTVQVCSDIRVSLTLAVKVSAFFRVCVCLVIVHAFFFQLSVLGSSGSGKSVLITEILNNFSKITDSAVEPAFVYCYKTQLPEGLKTTKCCFSYPGIPNIANIKAELVQEGRPLVIILDDLLSGTKNNNNNNNNNINNTDYC